MPQRVLSGPSVREQTGQRRRPLYLHARLNHRREGPRTARDVAGEQAGEIERKTGAV